MNVFKKIIYYLCRFLFGATFIFSGFVKCIDPLGTVYKIQDYIVALGLEAFLPIAYFAAWMLFSAELLCGLMIFFGIRPKEGIILGGVFMLAMTPLTLWIALENPVSDCGCFGDALVISNWETFWKNIVLSVMIIALYLLRANYKEYLSKFPAWLTVAAFFLIPCAIASITMHYLPIKDFRPYHIGADIEKQMEIPEGALLDVYKTTFIYENNGEEREFDQTELLNIDYTKWSFVDQKTVLIAKGYEPPIHDFAIVTSDGYDITKEILDDPGRTYLCAMYDLNLTDEDCMQDVNIAYQMAMAEGARFIALTASNDADVANFIAKHNITYPFAMTDPIQLKTMVRANPGIVIVKNGIITDKWNVVTQARHLKNNKQYPTLIEE